MIWRVIWVDLGMIWGHSRDMYVLGLSGWSDFGAFFGDLRRFVGVLGWSGVSGVRLSTFFLRVQLIGEALFLCVQLIGLLVVKV